MKCVFGLSRVIFVLSAMTLFHSLQVDAQDSPPELHLQLTSTCEDYLTPEHPLSQELFNVWQEFEELYNDRILRVMNVPISNKSIGSDTDITFEKEIAENYIRKELRNYIEEHLDGWRLSKPSKNLPDSYSSLSEQFRELVESNDLKNAINYITQIHALIREHYFKKYLITYDESNSLLHLSSDIHEFLGDTRSFGKFEKDRHKLFLANEQFVTQIEDFQAASIIGTFVLFFSGIHPHESIAPALLQQMLRSSDGINFIYAAVHSIYRSLKDLPYEHDSKVRRLIKSALHDAYVFHEEQNWEGVQDAVAEDLKQFESEIQNIELPPADTNAGFSLN